VKRLIQYSILLVLAIGLATGILWARGKSHDELCTSVVVEVVNADSTSFVTPKGVLNDLKSQGVKLVGKRMGDINASDLEEVLRQSPYLENADIVKCQDGRVLIRVSQLVPVLRVFDGTESYYVNRAGKRMMATPNYHCDVPVVQGHFSRAYPVTRILPLVDYVEKDSLLHSLVTMYCVRDTNNIIIVPNISGHVVNIGNAQGFENKFAKLRLFYDQVMPKRGWNTYDTISVKWSHQVVATRRVKAVQQVIEEDPEDDEQFPDIETLTPGSAATAKKEQEQEAAAAATATESSANDKDKNKKQN
jgi:cell division protein FtsQ